MAKNRTCFNCEMNHGMSNIFVGCWCSIGFSKVGVEKMRKDCSKWKKREARLGDRGYSRS